MSGRRLILVLLMVAVACHRRGGQGPADPESPAGQTRMVLPIPEAPAPPEFTHNGVVGCAWIVLPRKGGYVLVIRRDVLGSQRGAFVEDVVVPWSGVVPCTRATLRPGDRVRAGTSRESFYGVVAKPGPAAVKVRRMWRFRERTDEVPAEQVWKLKEEAGRLQVVFYRLGGRWFRGTLLARTREGILVLRENGGLMDIVPEGTEFLYPVLDTIQPHQQVRAFRGWGTGLRKGVVERVLIPDLYYLVRMGRIERRVPYWGITRP